MKIIKLNVTPDDALVRLDRFVAEADCGLTRSAAARLIFERMIKVNGREALKNYKLRAGDTIEITLPEPTPDRALPEDIALDIVYEDGDIIVINKPVGMVVHPAPGNPDRTLVNALLHHCGSSLSGIGGVIRPGIVHRIDKDTGGLIVAAKNDDSHRALAAQLRRHDMRRIYHAIVLGGMRGESGEIDAPLGRDPRNRKRMAIVRDENRKTREALTRWRVLERYSGFTYLLCELETGRTHQIRAHMAGIGHPLLGDTVYGGGRTDFERQNKKYISGQCLFAKELVLAHPRTGEEMIFSAELPENIKKLIEKLKRLS